MTRPRSAGGEVSEVDSSAGPGGVRPANRPALSGRIRRVAAHVVVDDLNSPQLAGDDAHHLGAVLRLRVGEPVGATDGRGGWRPCRYAGAASRGRKGAARQDAIDGRLEVDGEIEREERRLPPLTVAFALVKGDRPEWAVQKLSELGVDRIVVMHTDRSVVCWSGARAAGHIGRLRTVARQAVMQSRQLWLADVEGPEEFAPVAGRAGAALAGPEGGPPSLERPVVLVGPEGGWSEAETSTGLPVVSFGPTVLRAETAAVAAGAVLCAMRAGLCRPT